MKLLKILLALIVLNVFVYASEAVPTQEEVAKLYVATFNRAPDSAGLTYWTNNSGLKLSEIAQSFFDQPETQTLYPSGTSNRDFISSVYQNLFNRAPDTDGWNYWEEQLNAGAFSKNRFIEAVINGAQNTATSNDVTILTNKTIVGLSFSEAGLENVDDAKTIMIGVSDDEGTVTSAITSFGISLYGGIPSSNVPTAKISASNTDVIYKTTVDYLDASGSYDPEGVVLWIGWQYDEEAGYTIGSLSEKQTLNTFLDPGSHTVKLILFDYDGNQVATDTIDITIGFATPEPIYGCSVTGTGTVETVMDDGSLLTCSYFSFGVAEGRLTYEGRQIEDQYGYYKDGYEARWADNGLVRSLFYWQNKEASAVIYNTNNGEITSCTNPDGSSCMP